MATRAPSSPASDESPVLSSSSVAEALPSAAERGRLRRRFDRYHFVLLPGLLRGELLDRVKREIGGGEFEPLRHDTAHAELCLNPGRASALLMLLTNDTRVFDFVREVTGSDRIGSFRGRVYRMLPGPAHEGHWHDDVGDGRMVAMSLNLSDGEYSGGALALRECDSKRVLSEVANTGSGDALLFEISASLQHRVTAVDGEVAKTAWAGWYCSGADSKLARPGAAFRGGLE